MALPWPAEIQKSLGHSHVLGPEHPYRLKASWSVAHKLLHKAAMRLRMEKFYTVIDGGHDSLSAHP